MYSIGFQNFRRFQNFIPISYQGITFLVGRNNSGKSTLVKALLLIVDYLKADKINTFSFNEANIENANIATYGRAKSKNAKGDFIAYEYLQDNIRLKLVVTGDVDNTTADVGLFEIEDLTFGFRYTLKPIQNSITISNSGDKSIIVKDQDHSLLEGLQNEEKTLTEKLKVIAKKTSIEFIKINQDLQIIRKKISSLKSALRKEEIEGLFDLQANYSSQSLRDIINEALTEFSSEYELQYHDIQKGKKPKKVFESYKAFKDNKFKIEKSFSEILTIQSNIENIYLGATLQKQSALFAIRDKSNALSQTIHEYKQLGIDKDKSHEAYKFVQKWIKKSEFEIGDSFSIVMHAGEAYEVLVKNDDVNVHLADKGMGSVQCMLLILRLATIIYKKKADNKDYTVIIEEPELNLHPAHQSKLAKLFYEVNKEFNIKFIIETHSEYLIRSTQLIVKEIDLDEKSDGNPFTVIYFDKEQDQWKMNYRKDGKFIEDFGSGFFDETRNIVKQMI